MIGDSAQVEKGSTLHAQVCIVGSGAAGIPMALTLAERGLSVLLLEGGYDREDAASQALYAGEVADARLHSPLDTYRQRRLGGSTVIWGGRCVPFDPIDFEIRDYIAHSGWPITYDDVARFYPVANQFAEAGRCDYDATTALPADQGPMIAGLASDRISTDSLERFSCPTDFGARYRRRLELAQNLRVVLGANCTRIRLRADAASVDSLAVASLQGNEFSVRAEHYVLAAGGLEIPRLLLNSRDVCAAGIGNEHDVVGRYYMCHIAGNVGVLSVAGPTRGVRHGYEISADGVYCRRRISLRPEEQRRQRVANMVARLHFPRITDPAHHNGVLSGLFLARNLISYEYGKRLRDGAERGVGLYLRHLRNLLMDAPDTAGFLLHWLAKRTFAQRKFPSVILRNRTNRFSLEIHGEQVPRADSRAYLFGNTDPLGLQRLRVDWRYSSTDIESVARSLEVMAAEVARSGVGTLCFDRERLEEDLTRFGAYGGHHVGTTRMGLDRRSSVVDGDCRVHGVRNLFIASSAVFPTSSQANPTLTIIALALRLAEHIRSKSLTGQPPALTIGQGAP